MQFFYKWLRRKLENTHDLSCETIPETRSARIKSNGMDFSVYRASGGYIVEYHRYDRKSDDREHKLHIITEDTDLGQGLSQVITLEMLRH